MKIYKYISLYIFRFSKIDEIAPSGYSAYLSRFTSHSSSPSSLLAHAFIFKNVVRKCQWLSNVFTFPFLIPLSFVKFGEPRDRRITPSAVASSLCTSPLVLGPPLTLRTLVHPYIPSCTWHAASRREPGVGRRRAATVARSPAPFRNTPAVEERSSAAHSCADRDRERGTGSSPRSGTLRKARAVDRVIEGFPSIPFGVPRV